MNEPREQFLISRIIDNDATDQQWRELEGLAQTEPGLWRELAEALRDHVQLSQALDRAGAIADAIALPQRAPAETVAEHSRNHLRFNRLGAWTGWAAAALVAVVASLRTADPINNVAPPSGNQAQLVGLDPFTSAAQAFQAYLDKGQESGEVVGEMPARVLVETRPAVSGTGYELLYLRQVLERTVVPDLYQIDGHDELGQPTLVRYAQPVRSSM